MQTLSSECDRDNSEQQCLRVDGGNRITLGENESRLECDAVTLSITI
jgi:hypothetical protein